MALFGRDYDSYYRSNDRSRSHWGRSGEPLNERYDRGYGFQSGRGESAGWGAGRFGSPDYGYGSRGYGREFRADGPTRYDREFNRYDRNYKSQWQTDYGDPFGDRQQQTPMRVIREGEYRGRGNDYGRDFEEDRYPMGYRPYSSRAGYDVNYDQRLYRTQGRGYDRGWF